MPDSQMFIPSHSAHYETRVGVDVIVEGDTQ